MKKDNTDKEKMKAFYRKVAGTSLFIHGVLDENTTPPSKEPTKLIPSGKQSK